MRIELTTSSLPRKCSTPELQRLVRFGPRQCAAGPFGTSLYLHMSGRRGSNPRPTAWKAVALPTELLPRFTDNYWHQPLLSPCGHFLPFHSTRGQGWIRTTELRRGQIYSLLPLATWLLARLCFAASHAAFSLNARPLLHLIF